MSKRRLLNGGFAALVGMVLIGCGGGGSGGGSDEGTLSFTSAATADVSENTTAVLTVTTNDPGAALAITGGADSAQFVLGGSTLAFKTAPDYEEPSDADTDNTYEVTVRATDTSGNGVEQNISVNILDVNEVAPDTTPPNFTSPASADIAENTTAVLTVTTDDANATLAITGGADGSLFELSGSNLAFKSAPDFENPVDSGTNNIYEVTVSASDPALNHSEQTISVTVIDVSEPTVSLVILKTGQTGSYDTSGNAVTDGSVKDDGYYQSGADRNYTRDDAKEIVTDNATGLMWQDNNETASVMKKWLNDVNYAECALNQNLPKCFDTTGDTAAAYCENLTLGGYADWRLPTVQELLSITDAVHANPAIHPTFQNVASTIYWTSTTYTHAPEQAWSVYFYLGESNSFYDKYFDEAYIRCVRKGL
ncbi:Lcl domain-containing protein [Thiomicrolovo sp. ZZH C-3]